MNYIIDSCVWIDFFIKKEHFESISTLIIDDLVYTNKIILSELLPSAKKNRETELIECLSGLELVPLSIDWDEIADIQYNCLKSGINKLGLLDIAIAQNAKQNKMGIYSTDRHMELLSRKMGFKLKTE
jgi:predicted nucleic acid-binding protein